jgi:hypothetical protein
MSTVIESAPARSDSSHSPRMAHISFDDTPHVALCGAVLQGELAEPGANECVVCAEIDRDLTAQGL